MIAWGREKRQKTKEVNYNERNLWEQSVKETSSEIEPRKKKTGRSNSNKIKINRSRRPKSNSNSRSKISNRRSSSSKSSQKEKQNKKNTDYDSQNGDDYYDNEEESGSDTSDDESENYSENSGYDENDSEDDDEESNYEESEDDSKLSMSHRRIKPVKIFEISQKKKPVKKGKKSKSKSKNKKETSSSKNNKNKKNTNNRNKKRANDYSSENDSEYDYESEEEEMVQGILGIRDSGDAEHERALRKDDSSATTTDDETQETQYYVKFKDRSYQQCQWLTKQQLFQVKGGDKAWKNFNKHVKPQDISDMTPSLSIPDLLVTDETSINSDWYEIDRIIDDANDHNRREYLVKWKSQEYSESTWELEGNIKDKNKIEEYEERLQRSNPKKFNTRYKRPSPDKFEELTEPPESKINTKLRDYQLDGLNWLRNCWYHKKNNILADEMGLGKTAQIVCFLNDLYLNEGLSGPFLVVAPVSTLAHWKLEFERWTDLNCIVFHGDKESREMIINCEIKYFDDDGKEQKNRVGFDVMVTNYEILRSDKPSRIISSIQWRYLVVDEAHRMKNSKSAIFNQLKRLEFDHCTLLTGTPIQNDMSELWSLLNFIDPKHYNDLDSFMEKYGNKTDSSQIKEIHKIIRPILLRRKKGDVEKDILPKDETIIEVELTRTQKQFYKAFLNENASQLLQKMTSNRSASPSLLNLMMQLRKVCNHPFLIVGAEKSIFDETRRKNSTLNLSKKEIRFKSLVESSGKMILIDKLLPKLRADNHKVLIFSQMVKILDLLENYLIYKEYSYERLDGGVSESDRQQSIERFNNDPDRFIFLLSTKAGGIGINLTAADTVIIYDSDWNPQNDIQAEARCHRIGQTSMVKVYRLITRNTYESEMFVRASKKLALDHVVLDGGNLEDQPLKTCEIEKMLRHGAYAMFNDSKDDDDAEIDKFCSADIDQILSSRTRRVQEDVVAGGGSVFSNVTFNATDDDLDINSVDFWSQVFPLGGGIEKADQFHGSRKRKETIRLNFGQVRRMIQFIIDKGYPPSLSDNDNEIAHAVLQIAYSLNKPRDYRNAEIIEFYLRGHRLPKNNGNNNENENDEDDSNSDDSEQENFDLDDPMKEYGDQVVYVVDEKADKIIKRVIFFYRLKECLFRIQGDGFKWPEVKPLWDSPLKEYALMIGTLRYGLSDISQIYEDESLGLEHSKLLKKQQIETRVDQIVTKIEDQFIAILNEESKNESKNKNKDKKDENKNKDDENNEYDDDYDDDDVDLPLIDVPDKFEPMEPSEWSKVHSDIFIKNLMTDKEINAIIQVVLEFGIPIKLPQNNQNENENENNENSTEKVSGSGVDDESDIDSVRIIELASPSLDKVSPDVVKSFIEKLSFVVNRIQGGDDENEDESDNENDNDNETTSNSNSVSKSKSLEIDLSDFPELQKLSATRIKNLKQSISIMSTVYEFIKSVIRHPDKEEFCTEVKSNSQFPPWWSSRCDKSMIDSFGKYGQNFVYSMLADKDYPFYTNLTEQQKEIIDANAEQERSKNRPQPFDEENLSDLKALFSRRSRIPRVLSFINHVNKRYERKQKDKKRHHSHSSSSSSSSSSSRRRSEKSTNKTASSSSGSLDSGENKRKNSVVSAAEREKYFKKEMIIGSNVEEVVHNLRNPQAGQKLPHPADFYLNSKRLSSMKYPNAFGLNILVRKRNIRIMSFGEKRSEKQFLTKSLNVTLNPGFVSFRKYPVLATPVFEQRWYICEIIDLNDKPFFRITDIDRPEFTFTDDDIVKLFVNFFAYLRHRYLPDYKKKKSNSNKEEVSQINNNNNNSDDEDDEDEVVLKIFNELDEKDQKVAPLTVTPYKCYTIFGLNEKEDENNSEDENANSAHQAASGSDLTETGSGSSSRVERSNANLLDGLIPIHFDLPLFDVSLFPQLKNFVGKKENERK